MLRLLGCVPALTLVRAGTPGAATPAAAVLEDYRGYLARERGLAARTITGYLAVARLFLARWERPDCLDLQRLTAGQVTAFVLDECGRRNVGSANVLVTALRSPLRFLSLERHTSQPLASAGPAVSGPAPDGPPPRADARIVPRL